MVGELVRRQVEILIFIKNNENGKFTTNVYSNGAIGGYAQDKPTGEWFASQNGGDFSSKTMIILGDKSYISSPSALDYRYTSNFNGGTQGTKGFVAGAFQDIYGGGGGGASAFGNGGNGGSYGNETGYDGGIGAGGGGAYVKVGDVTYGVGGQCFVEVFF